MLACFKRVEDEIQEPTKEKKVCLFVKNPRVFDDNRDREQTFKFETNKHFFCFFKLGDHKIVLWPRLPQGDLIFG